MKGAKSLDKDWQAEGDMHTLLRAEEIKRDPKRLKAARECAKKQLEAAAQVVGTTAE